MRRVLFALALAACVPLPPQIYPGQVRAVFAVEGPDRAAVDDAADRCAARLNGLVRAARASGAARTSLTASGALLGGAGAVVGALPGDDATRDDVAVMLGVVGAGVGLLATFVASITGDPAELLARHTRGTRSWDAAREALRRPHAGEGIDTVLGHLERCVRDEAPARAALPPRGPGTPQP